jgi:predicted dehydrogenase
MRTTNNFDYHDLIAFRKEDVEILKVVVMPSSTKVFRYQNRLKKFFFFLVREGPITLWRKIRSRRFQQGIERKEVFVVARVKGSSLFFGGRQLSIDQPYYYFLRSSGRDTLPLSNEFEHIMHLNPMVGYIPPEIQGVGGYLHPYDTKFSPIVIERKGNQNRSDCDLYVVGCGDYVRTQVLPLFRSLNPFAAVDFNSEILQSRYLRMFRYCTNDFHKALEFKSTGQTRVGIIASYHSYHTSQALDFLRLPESTVFIEKPPCLTIDELVCLSQQFDPHRMFVGYNRRFIPWNWILRELLDRHDSPVVMTMLISESQITPQHWYLAPNQGTRVSGNLSHFVDLAVFLLQRRPFKITVARNTVAGIDRSTFVILFEDGSIVNLIPTDLGDGTTGVQERIYIKGEGLDVFVADYLSMRIWDRGKVRTFHSLKRDKGHKTMYREFKKSILESRPSALTVRDLVYSCMVYLSMVRLCLSVEDSQELDYSGFEPYLN